MRKTRHRRSLRSAKGMQIAEFAAASVLILPLFLIIVYLTYQIALYMYLKSGVDIAAKTEARWLAINFNDLVQQNGNSAANYANWKNSGVRVARCVTSNAQFINGTIDSSGNFVATAPAVLTAGECLTSASGQGVVAVKVIYPGSSGLPAWPNPVLRFFGAKLAPTNMTIAGIYVADIEP
ncbi:MAG TPA: pilus assembly protein [Candidatus Melainabacteria bacterium]|nr:pilus assembly protein [Candidatus Melainabacteria bacterium]